MKKARLGGLFSEFIDVKEVIVHCVRQEVKAVTFVSRQATRDKQTRHLALTSWRTQWAMTSLTSLTSKRKRLQRLQQPACLLLFLLRTLRAKPLHHVVYAVDAEAVGQRNHGHMYALEAESAVAPLAIEVRMLVVNAAVAVVGAHVVLQRAAPVVNGMYEFAQQKDGERA